MWHKYIVSMNAKSTPQSVLHQIAQIQRLERGTVSVIRQGPDGAYYNHQCYEEGRNVSRYVPLEQVAEVKEGIDGYRRFQELVQQYVQLTVEKTRAQREAGLKPRRQRSSLGFFLGGGRCEPSFLAEQSVGSQRSLLRRKRSRR